MRLIFCTYPSLYSAVVLKTLWQIPDIQVVGVVCSTRVLRKDYSTFYGSWRQFVRSGPQYASYLWWITSGYRLLYRLKKRLTFDGLLEQYTAGPILYTDDINQVSAQNYLQDRQADFLLSAHFNQLIAPQTLTLPVVGCLNIHPSLLPDYKGVDPAFTLCLMVQYIRG